MADQAQAAAHWDAAYAQGDQTLSWYEEHPGMSLRMLGAAGVSAADAVIDVGGGASPLTAACYSPAQLARQLGATWLLISQDREEYITPAGTTQPFTWIALRRQS